MTLIHVIRRLRCVRNVMMNMYILYSVHKAIASVNTRYISYSIILIAPLTPSNCTYDLCNQQGRQVPYTD
jgi:hypothetical protein